MEQHAYESTDALDRRRRARHERSEEHTALYAFVACALLLVILVVVAVRVGDVVPEGAAAPSSEVLVTGFVEFDGVENPSKVAARALNGSLVGPRGAAARIFAELLPVSTIGASWAAAALATRPFKAVVHLGLEESSRDLRVEIAGHNVLGAGDDGSCATTPAIPGAPCVLATTAPLGRLVLVDEEWSTDAGVFFCNEAYYRTLARVRGHDGGAPVTGERGLVPVVFVHLPAETTMAVDTYLERLRRLVDVVAGGSARVDAGRRLRGR